MMLYIGASEPLPLIPWDESTPGFHVTELDRELDKKACTQFTLPHVFYAGSYEGCGCDFTEGQHPKEGDQSLEAKKSLSDLARYLNDALSKEISTQ